MGQIERSELLNGFGEYEGLGHIEYGRAELNGKGGLTEGEEYEILVPGLLETSPIIIIYEAAVGSKEPVVSCSIVIRKGGSSYLRSERGFVCLLGSKISEHQISYMNWIAFGVEIL